MNNLSKRLKSKLVTETIRVLGVLPLSFNQALGFFIGHLAWFIPSETKRISQINIKLCMPQIHEQQRHKIAKQSFIKAIMTALEIPVFWSRPFQQNRQLIKHVENESYLDDALAKQHGVILIIPHLGNWELCNHYMSTKSDVTALYLPAKIPALDALMRDSREQARTQVVPTSTGGIRQLLKTLKSGGCTAILPDQEPEPAGGIYCTFFGQAALSSVLVSKMIQKTGALPIMLSAIRMGVGGGFRVIIKSCPTGLSSPDLATSVQALNDATQAFIMEHPTDYQWSYKRFKHHPDGQINPYDSHLS